MARARAKNGCDGVFHATRPGWRRPPDVRPIARQDDGEREPDGDVEMRKLRAPFCLALLALTVSACGALFGVDFDDVRPAAMLGPDATSNEDDAATSATNEPVSSPEPSVPTARALPIASAATTSASLDAIRPTAARPPLARRARSRTASRHASAERA